MAETGGGGNPYATLNVPQDASKDQIRGAFVRVARSIHPDKAGSSQNANEMYSKVDEAWKVLGDAQMKDAYDSFGPVGPQALQVMRQHMDSKRISKHQVRQQIDLARELQLEEELQSTSSVVCSLRLEDLVRAFSSSAPTAGDFMEGPTTAAAAASRLLPPPPAVLEHVLLEQNTFFTVNQHNMLILQAAAGSQRKKKRPMLGSFTVGWIATRGLNTFTAHLAFNALSVQPPARVRRGEGDVLPKLTLKGTRHFSDKLTCGLEFNGDFNTSLERPMHPGLQLSCRRVFSRYTESNVFWGVGSMEGVGAGVRHFQPKLLKTTSSKVMGEQDKRKGKRWLECKMELSAADGNPSMQASWTEPITPTQRYKTSLAASAAHVYVEVERHAVLPGRTRVSAAVAVTFPEGIRLKLKLHRPGGVRYEFPVFITSNITLLNAVLTGLVPMAALYVAQRLLAPFRTRARLARRAKLVSECQAWRVRAQQQRQLMRATAEANKSNKSGLEISQAWFGKPAGGSGGGDADVGQWEEETGGVVLLPARIDVTVQLNFLLSKQTSTLDLAAGSKSDLLGFYDPSIVRGEDGVWAFDPQAEDDDEEEEEEDEGGEQAASSGNELYVKYKYQDRTYEITFGEQQAVHLPSPDAVLL